MPSRISSISSPGTWISRAKFRSGSAHSEDAPQHYEHCLKSKYPVGNPGYSHIFDFRNVLQSGIGMPQLMGDDSNQSRKPAGIGNQSRVSGQSAQRPQKSSPPGGFQFYSQR